MPVAFTLGMPSVCSCKIGWRNAAPKHKKAPRRGAFYLYGSGHNGVEMLLKCIF